MASDKENINLNDYDNLMSIFDNIASKDNQKSEDNISEQNDSSENENKNEEVDLNKKYQKLYFDELKLYFGDDYKVTDKITVKQPTIGKIVEWGEQKYWSMVYTLTCIPSNMKSQLEDMGINYMKIKDFELFVILSHTMTPTQTGILLGDLDLSKFVQCQNTKTGEYVLYDEDNDIIIDNHTYELLTGYIRKMHNIIPKVEHADCETTRQILIRLDRQKIKENKDKPYKSQLKELISGMMRYPGFKYKKSELKECGIYEFMDTVQGAQIYVSSTALLKGAYSGMIDTSKINKKEFNWMRNANE